MSMLDLRRFHIKNYGDVKEFLDFVVSRTEEIKTLVKKQNTKITSLQNVVEFERKQNSGVPTSVQSAIQPEDAPTTPVGPTAEQIAINKMKQSQVEPGEVGELKLPGDTNLTEDSSNLTPKSDGVKSIKGGLKKK